MRGWNERIAMLFRQHRRKLELVAARVTGNSEVASDIVQDVFSRALHHGEDPRWDDGALKILYASARNASIDYIRQEKRHAEIFERLMPEQLNSPPALQDAVAEGREALQSFGHILMQMPETTRSILLMRRVHGLSNAEIASRHGISVSAVEKHIARAIRHCQAGMPDYFGP